MIEEVSLVPESYSFSLHFVLIESNTYFFSRNIVC